MNRSDQIAFHGGRRGEVTLVRWPKRCCR